MKEDIRVTVLEIGTLRETIREVLREEVNKLKNLDLLQRIDLYKLLSQAYNIIA